MINGTDSYSYGSYSEDVPHEIEVLEKSNDNAQKLFAGLKPNPNIGTDETITFTKLYIKMEYCEYDLEHVISEIVREKSKSEDENILRQVDALFAFKDSKGTNNFGIFCPVNI